VHRELVRHLEMGVAVMDRHTLALYITAAYSPIRPRQSRGRYPTHSPAFRPLDVLPFVVARKLGGEFRNLPNDLMSGLGSQS
jgi:hypothetical protein